MIDTKDRLKKLLKRCQNYEQFERMAIAKSSWVLAPYVAVGHVVTKTWLQAFYCDNGGK